jgi:DNA replication protein DnaC
MSRQLDQTISDAASRNLSFPQTLESLADLELEARNARSIERRCRLSRLQAQYSIDSFNFKHHKSRAELKTRILRLLDLDFLQKGASAIFIGNPGVGKRSWLRSSPRKPARRISVCSSPTAWICSITCWLRRWITR